MRFGPVSAVPERSRRGSKWTFNGAPFGKLRAGSKGAPLQRQRPGKHLFSPPPAIK
jgi:hypothetical protein